MGVPTHWSGAGNGGTGGDRGIYHPPPEDGCAINCKPSYHGIVFGGGAEFGNAPIKEMMGTDRPVYNGYQGGAGSRIGEEGYGGGGDRSRRERDSRGGVDDGDIMICYKNQRLFSGGQAGWRYKVARKPIGAVPNAPLASALGM